MKNSNKHAIFQLTKLIETLRRDSVVLNTNEYITILNALKDICANKQFNETLIQSLKALYEKKIYNKKSLTNREQQILLLIGEGLKNAHIAKRLSLSMSTVETHRKNIRKKLKIKEKDSLIVFALIYNLQHQNSSEI